MYQRKLSTDIRCPLEYGIKMLDGKWNSRILCLIGKLGSLRFGEMKTDLVNITDGVLAAALNDLIGFDLIEKKSIPGQTGMVEYELTEKGQSLIPLVQKLCQWSTNYFKDPTGIAMVHCAQCGIYKKWSAEIESSAQDQPL